MTPGNTEGAGTRVFPAKTNKNDEKSGLRINKGEALHNEPHKHNVFLQQNENVEDPAIRKLAKKNSHAKLSHTIIDTTKGTTEEAVTEVWEQFENNLII
ncbi:hypothetical protein A1F99_109330 [Pyrenophora tritici-repentis]|nr:hypothetical protein A1F99_109330 [Pyrenophora tritici-repentis]KAI1509139.1 hypothetical protein Ptr86124_012095 [Pyrenophora tritici-repentis]KAI1667814.1 hypothetical protein L13192_08523 [Pyrenophora tritici-repentis]KAI1680026.1 hypothetical protein KJE20_10666 [Pyrenophora tritici-repentis]